jgi:hypothetical protein
MALRGYTDKSPVTLQSNKGQWPDSYIDYPHQQFRLLEEKYRDREEGRIPLPRNEQQLWSHHKYSVLARDPELYKKIGRDLSRTAMEFSDLSRLLAEVLREKPTEGGLRNAVQHMWGYVSDSSPESQSGMSGWSLRKLLTETQKRTLEYDVKYLICSTALSELMVWLPDS